MKIPLFDIDGTLLVGGGGEGAKIHKESFNHAFSSIYDMPSASVYEITTDGMVDKQILEEVLKKHGLHEPEIRAKIDIAIAAMVQYCSDRMDEITATAAPGAKNLLDKLANLKMPLGLLTGNVKEIGIWKLEKANLAHYFKFGAFGSQAFRRIDLIDLAMQDARKNLNQDISRDKLVIIGDSYLDIRCANEGKIQSIGVATANSTRQQLEDEGANIVVDSLLDADKIVKFLSLE